MPASCANALRPVIALFGCTGTPVISLNIWLAEKIRIGTGRILGRKFNILTQRFSEADRLARLLQTLLPRDAQLVLKMNIGSGQNHMNTRPRRALQGFPRALDVEMTRARECSNNGPPHHLGNRLH